MPLSVPVVLPALVPEQIQRRLVLLDREDAGGMYTDSLGIRDTVPPAGIVLLTPSMLSSTGVVASFSSGAEFRTWRTSSPTHRLMMSSIFSQVAVGFVLALLCRDLSYFLGNPIMRETGPRLSTVPTIRPDETLIVFDEIQESKWALNVLKYFQEEANYYHVAAAGSLLGVKLSRHTNFPVGKVTFLRMYPLSFFEFLDL